MRLQNYREHWALERLLVYILISNKNVKVNHLLKNLRFEPLWSLFPLSCLKASGWYRNVLFKARLSSVGKTKEWRDKPVSPTSAVWRIQQCYFMMSIHTEKIRVCAFTLSRGILPMSLLQSCGEQYAAEIQTWPCQGTTGSLELLAGVWKTNEPNKLLKELVLEY